MQLKKAIVTACTVLCIGTALSAAAFAGEAALLGNEPPAQSVSALNDGLKEGPKSGLKNGLKEGLKDGLKNGLKDGEKR